MWHVQEADKVLEELGSSREGLAPSRVAGLQEEYGPNELVKKGGRTPLRILWEQFTATMVLILIAAGVLALVLGDSLEAIAIFAIVILFGIMGFLQEFRAEKALSALKKLAVPLVRVRRGGQISEISSASLVPGDIVLLEAGNLIPADARIVSNWGLKVQEAALTGESEAVDKELEPVADAAVGIGDRKNMVYMGTVVTFGRGEAVVCSTGMKTELGKIADLIQSVEEGQSPLQQRLEKLGQTLALVGVGLSVLVALLGVLAGEKLHEMLIVGVSMAVAIIPEGLPAVLTITLALGARRMFARHALIRKLPAVETLGSVTVICSDKTGTLTQNRMTVQSTHGVLGEIDPALIATLGSLCNDSRLGAPGPDGEPVIIGDPTEACLLTLAKVQGLDNNTLQATLPRVAELPFDSSRKRMSTFHSLAGIGNIPAGLAGALGTIAGKNPVLMSVKGSADGLLTICDRYLDAGQVKTMDAAARLAIEARVAELAGKGMRVLGFAARALELPAAAGLELESALVFVGLAGIIDPPRPEVRDAIAVCRQAGIRPVMITGDHPLTAKAIAADLCMSHSEKVITGKELEVMEDSELRAAVHECSVFARVSPEHKLRIVDAFQVQHQVVAMTGDGVNDAPALRKADIGVAMGITGTDVSKEASQMVLTDDNFASIVSAVEEGRVIYDNIRKYIKFSLGGNAGKIVVLLLLPLFTGILASAMGLAVAPVMVGLSAIQLLWLNLLGDGLLSVGLGVEHGEADVMQRQPIKPKSGIFDKDMNGYVLTNGIVMGLIALAVGVWWWLGLDKQATHEEQLRLIQTVVFMVLFFLQFWSVFAVRTGSKSVFRSGMKPNGLVLGMAGLSLALQFAGMYVPFLRDFLGLATLSWQDSLVLFGIGAIMIPVLEVQKYFQRRNRPA